MNADYLHEQMMDLAHSWEPTEAQKRAAKTSQRAIREALDSGNMAARIIDDYLSGSYARQTAIAPIDDVDIIFVIDPKYWEKPLLSDCPDPEKVLTTFANAIRLRRESSRVEMQRRSVGLKMQHLDIDAVPAIATERDGYIRIPDREKRDWIRTAPRVHADRAKEVNQARDGMFKPLVKILKGWNSELHKDDALKSFSIETMALRIFKDTPFRTMFDGALLFFDFLAGQFAEETEYEWPNDFGVRLKWLNWGYELLDVAGTGSNLLSGLSEKRREGFLSEALETRDLLLKVKNSRSEDRCLDLLEEAFGERVG